MIQTEGNVVIDSYGIATCNEDCSISFKPENGQLFNSAFSFLAIQISPEAKITFGISDNSISFNYFTFLSDIRNEKISPQIQIDGIGILINIYVNKLGIILIYVNGELYSNTRTIKNMDSYFFLNISDSKSRPTIIATPIIFPKNQEGYELKFDEKNNFIYNKLEMNDLSRIFPVFEPDFWNFNHRTACISDFYVGSVTSYSQYCMIISQKSLLPLPCSQMKFYFEIIVHSIYNLTDSIDFSFGLTPHILLDHKSQQSNRTLPLYSFVFYNYKNDLVKHGTNRSSANIRSQIKSVPFTLGFGIANDQIYFTYDGEIICQMTINGHMTDNEINGLHLYPFIMLPTRGIEVEFNFGQRPFTHKSDMMTIADGWTLWYPPTHEHIFKIGMPPHRHLLNVFLSFGLQMDNPTQLQLKKELPEDEGKFEIHMLHLEKPELIGCGFSNKDFIPGQMVGWDPKCVGLHSDDGKLFFQTGGGTMNVVSPFSIHTGTTETVYLRGKNLSYYIDRLKKENVCVFPFERYPTITAKGGVEFVLNFGESPFYAFESDYEEEDAVTLFNKLKVKLSNFLLPIFNLMVGDVIESRDRSFRGTIAGSSDDRIYVYIPNYPGAFPIVETTSYEFHLNYRIVYRKESLFQRVVSNKNENVIIDISEGCFDKLYPTQIGLAFFIGTAKLKGSVCYVFRPVEDLINNLPCIVLNEKPLDIMDQSGSKLFPLFHGICDNMNAEFSENNDQLSFQLFDVIQFTRKDKKKYFLVLGVSCKDSFDGMNSIFCFDGTQFLRIELSSQSMNRKNMKFLINPFGFRRERFKYNFAYDPSPCYIGMTIGGRRYPFNFKCIYGSYFEVEIKTENLFPSGDKGDHLPPLLDYFLRRLNSKFTALMYKDNGPGSSKEAIENDEVENDWLYTTEEKKFEVKLNLVTDEDFNDNFTLLGSLK